MKELGLILSGEKNMMLNLQFKNTILYVHSPDIHSHKAISTSFDEVVLEQFREIRVK